LACPVFHHPDLAYSARHHRRTPGAHYLEPCSPTALPGTPGNRALDISHLALRFRYRCHRLHHALPSLRSLISTAFLDQRSHHLGGGCTRPETVSLSLRHDDPVMAITKAKPSVSGIVSSLARSDRNATSSRLGTASPGCATGRPRAKGAAPHGKECE